MENRRKWQDKYWWWRGAQSAVFFYAQCGPCLAWREGKRQKKQWKQEKKERTMYAEQSGILRQPQAHEINPAWEEEIRLGPGPVKKGRKRADTKDTMSSEVDGSLKDFIGDSEERPMYWNAKRFQRPDEEIVYVDPTTERDKMEYAPPGLIRRGSSVGVGAWMVDTNEPPQKPRRTYTPTASMPPVNELHPPVVSPVPSKKEDRAWMTAPPPSAAFMHGKKGVTTRSRSGSGNTSVQSADARLNRHLGNKILDEELEAGSQLPMGTNVRPSSRRMKSSEGIELPAAQRTNSTSPFRLVREKTPPSPMRARERRPAPLRLKSNQSAKTTSTRKLSDTESGTSSSSESSKRQSRAPARYQSITKTRMNARSALNSNPVSPPVQSKSHVASESTSTLASTKFSPSSTLQPAKDSATLTPPTASPPVRDDYTPSPRKQKENRSGRAPLLVKDSSLHVLQDVVDPHVLLNSKWVRSPVIEARVPLPAGGDSPVKLKENDSPPKVLQTSAKEQLLMESRRWSWTA